MTRPPFETSVLSHEHVLEDFARVFGRQPEFIITAPGRVNVIGEHVDYNGGWVLPAAIDRHLLFAVAGRADQRVRLSTTEFAGTTDFDLKGLAPSTAKDWGRYVRGVLAGLVELGHAVPGFDAHLASTIPMGGGLSSSAALEAAVGLAALSLCQATLDRFALAKICQQAEHLYAGVPCGIMDQAAVLCCEPYHLLLLDCELETFVQVPFIAKGWCLVILNSGVSHNLATSEYARRRHACEQAAQRLDRPSLRHVPIADLASSLATPALTEEMQRCVHHVVTENDRTKRFVAALKQGDVKSAGLLLNASHQSLRDDYRVSCDELDFIAATAQQSGDVAGCRMTGGGFGGSCVALVRQESAGEVCQRVGEAFHQRFGWHLTSFVTPASAGARVTKC